MLDAYADQTPQWLSDLTHSEPPWKNARERAGVSDLESSCDEIPVAAMAEYYETLISS